MSKKGLVLCALAFFGVLFLIGCDSSNAVAGYGGGAVGNTPPNPPRATGGNAYGTTGDAQVSGPSAETQVNGSQ